MNSTRPRLLLLSPLPPPTGGITTWTLGVLDSDLAQRFEIRVVNTSPSEKQAVSGESRFRLGRALDAARILFSLVCALVVFRPHLVHINTPYRWAMLRDGLAVWVASATGARTVLHFHGGEFPEWMAAAPSFVRTAILASLRRTDRLIAITHHTRVYLERVVGADRVRFVPNFVSLEDLGELPDRSKRHQESINVLFVGWIIEAKGVRELLAAAGRLPEACFTLVGPAEPSFVRSIRPALEALSPRLRLLPPRAREDVMPLYGDADIFVLPSWSEGFPNVVLEAMAAGLPVVATPVGAIGDAVRDGIEGILVAPRDAAQLTAALARLLKERELRLDMGRRARERARDVFSREAVLGQLELLYREILNPDAVRPGQQAEPP